MRIRARCDICGALAWLYSSGYPVICVCRPCYEKQNAKNRRSNDNQSEWNPAKKFRTPLFYDESPWECPLCGKLVPHEEAHAANCSFLTLENKISHVSF